MAKYKYEFLELYVDNYSVLIDVNTRIKTLLGCRHLYGPGYTFHFLSGMTTIINPDGTPNLATDEEIEYLKSIAVDYNTNAWSDRRLSSSNIVIYRCAEF